MFHVELRQFPHVARAFNLNPEELHARVLAPWTAGRPVDLEDHRWDPSRAKLTIYQARELAGEDLGMGRGWGTVTREGEDVTEQLLVAARAQDEGLAELSEVKTQLLAAATAQPLSLYRVVESIGDVTWRASERLRVAEQAVWELLHEERLNLVQGGVVLTRDRWQPVILSLSSWSPDTPVAVRATQES